MLGHLNAKNSEIFEATEKKDYAVYLKWNGMGFPLIDFIPPHTQIYRVLE